MNQAPPTRVHERFLLAALFFIQAHAISLWFVPFSSVLRAHALEWLLPWAFAASAIAAFISPMLTGSLADQHLSATVLLRRLSLFIALFLGLTFWAIEHGWHAGWILLFIQLQHLCSAPSWGLTTQLVLAKLPDPSRQFGPLRVWATYGWMAGGLLVSLGLSADSSTHSGFAAAAAWVAVAGFTFLIPAPKPAATSASKSFRSLLGLEALVLLKHPRHRSVFLSAALLSIPLAAFYPYAPLQMKDLGLSQTSAWMSLGQITEALGMYLLAPLLTRFRLRTLFIAGISIGFVRYLLLATHTIPSVILGVFLHGACFTLFFIPGQIYIERRIEPALRYRAQALQTLLIGGFGNLFGYLGCGWLRSYCTAVTQGHWQLYWNILAMAVMAVGVYFIRAYGAPNHEDPEKLAPLPEPAATR